MRCVFLTTLFQAMRAGRSLVALLLVSIILVACSKKKDDSPAPAAPSANTAVVAFYLDNAEPCRDSVAVTVAGQTGYIVGHNSSGFPSCFHPGSYVRELAPGSYPYTARNCLGKEWAGTVTVPTVITDCIPVKLTSTGLGYVTFWSNTDLTPAGTITVTMDDGQSQQITTQSNVIMSGYLVPPRWNSAGSAHFELSGGLHRYTATGPNGITWDDTITVRSGVPVQGYTQQRLLTGQRAGWAQAAFYADHQLTGPVTITVASRTGQITSSVGTAIPSCGMAGLYNVWLPFGTHSFTSSGGGLNANGTFTLTNQNTYCQLVRADGVNGTSGRITLWTSLFPAGCSTMEVTINGGNARTMTATYPNQPSGCGFVNGCANYLLPPGTYTFRVRCGSNVRNVSGIVLANSCLFLRI